MTTRKQTEAEHLNSLIDWCRSRLKNDKYREVLDKYRKRGPRKIRPDEPKLIHS